MQIFWGLRMAQVVPVACPVTADLTLAQLLSFTHPFSSAWVPPLYQTGNGLWGLRAESDPGLTLLGLSVSG